MDNRELVVKVECVYAHKRIDSVERLWHAERAGVVPRDVLCELYHLSESALLIRHSLKLALTDSYVFASSHRNLNWAKTGSSAGSSSTSTMVPSVPGT